MVVNTGKTKVLKRCTIDQVQHLFRRYARGDTAGVFQMESSGFTEMVIKLKPSCFEDVIAAGVVVIAAMGNEYEEGNPTEYPAAIREVCAVGATDELDKRAPFSNTGRHIDLVAPGVDILSTTPTFNYDGDGEQEYDAWDGTSAGGTGTLEFVLTIAAGQEADP